MEEQVAKCLCEGFVIDTASSMVVKPRDVDTISTTTKDVGGLKLRLTVSPDKGLYSFKTTYKSEWLIRKDRK